MSNGTITKSRSYTYGTDGMLATRTLPGGKIYSYSYDDYGNVTGVNAAGSAVKWSLTGYTGKRTTSSIVLNNSTYYSFNKATVLDQYGYLDSLITDKNGSRYQDDDYNFSPLTGNLMSLDASWMDYPHTFQYDSADRLTRVQENNQDIMYMTYSANGNILSKTGIGYYEYSNTAQPHAVTAVDNFENWIEDTIQYVSYNSWGKLESLYSIRDGDVYYYSIEYGPDLQRIRSSLYKNGQPLYSKFYWDDYEEKTENNTTYLYWYVNGADGLAGIMLGNAQNSSWSCNLAAITDHLGSIMTLWDNNDPYYSCSYDVWGNRTIGMESPLGIDRGFCGHEHIDEIGLIDMNGRMYDPKLGRFLSPDNYIQSPGNPQNYNRYSYCLNNPLKYSDPDGESWLLAAGITALLLLTNEGYEFQKAVSPIALHLDVHLGTHQFGLGYDVSVGMSTLKPISYRYHYGETYYWKTYGGNSGWEYREGGEWRFKGLLVGLPYDITYSGTKFSGINSQITNSISVNKTPFTRTTYENDTELFVKLPGVPKYDNDDRYRTAAVSIKRGLFTLQTNLHTGEPGKKGENIDGDGTKGNPYHFVGGDIDKQHHGILSLGIGPFRFGWDSEDIRHTFQNRLAHDWFWHYNYGFMYPWVLDNEQDDSFFFYFGSGSGNTMW